MSFSSRLRLLCKGYVPTRAGAEELCNGVLDMVNKKRIPIHNCGVFDEDCNEGCGEYWVIQISSYDPETRRCRNLEEI